jgi:hypothetical protein
MKEKNNHGTNPFNDSTINNNNNSNSSNKSNNNEEYDESWIPKKMLPHYFTELFEELYTEDGLMVLGRGLGWLSLLAVFIRWYSELQDQTNTNIAKHDENDHENPIQHNDNGNPSPTKQIHVSNHDTKPPLVFVLGLRDTERTALIQLLESWDTPPELLPTMITNESGQGKDREGKKKSELKRSKLFLDPIRLIIITHCPINKPCIDKVVFSASHQEY